MSEDSMRGMPNTAWPVTTKKPFGENIRLLFGGELINGKLGTVNSPFGRVLFLAGITAEVASLGYSSVELLMSLVGSWISAMLCRRRTLCLLETVYEALRGRELDDVLRLSGDYGPSCCPWLSWPPYCKRTSEQPRTTASVVSTPILRK